MNIAEIITCIEAEFPLALQENYDNCGLLIGDRNQLCTGVLTCIDVTEAIIDESLEKKCNLIISHHPLIFSGLKRITGSTETERIAARCIISGIAVYAVHTNADNHYQGVNQQLSSKLQLTNTRILKPVNGLLRKLITFCPADFSEPLRQALFDAGAGKIGNYDQCSFFSKGYGTFRAGEDANPFVGTTGKLHTENEVRIETIFPAYLQSQVIKSLLKAHPYEEPAFDILKIENDFQNVGAGMIGELENSMDVYEFLTNVKTILNLGCIKHTAVEALKIKKVALCGGSGSFLINDAIRSNADIYLTGDIKYHDFFIPGKRMILADIGHYESEQFTKELIYTLLKKKFTNFALFISGTNTNPVNYL
jgi:dinuclear metal center YbgI/SA1388 family protein